jgi:2-dehydro-3-deoxygluconokinase
MGLYLIEPDGAERSFHYWRDASAARKLADDPAVLETGLKGAGLVHLSGITLAILADPARETLFGAVAAARAAGAVVSFDPNIRPRLWASPEEMREVVGRMLTLCDISLPSYDDEHRHFGDSGPEETLRRHAAAGVAEVVLKDGPGPVRLLAGAEVLAVETPPVDGICDTSGAGDAFNAGYLVARLSGSDARAAIRLGQRLSATVLQHFGARATKAAVAALRAEMVGR